MESTKRKAIFLDRDGVINIDKQGEFICSPDQFRFVPNIKKNIKKLNEKGFLVIVVTNQAGIKLGFYSKAVLKKIHEKMIKGFKEAGAHLDDIFYCPHYKYDNCECRKPLPGLILKAAKKYNIDLKQSWVLGDNNNDIKAGQRAGCKTLKTKRNKNINKEIKKIINND
jgi:D-glycero-D-manno-heptose 1,7-bisphosphate phosphatase